MKNKLGTNEYLEECHSNGKKSYEYCVGSNGFSWEYTYDERDNELTFKNSDGFGWESTYDENGNELTCRNSNGFSFESTYNEQGNVLTYKDSDGCNDKYTYEYSNEIDKQVIMKNIDKDKQADKLYKKLAKATKKYLKLCKSNGLITPNQTIDDTLYVLLEHIVNLRHDLETLLSEEGSTDKVESKINLLLENGLYNHIDSKHKPNAFLVDVIYKDGESASASFSSDGRFYDYDNTDVTDNILYWKQN